MTYQQELIEGEEKKEDEELEIEDEEVAIPEIMKGESFNPKLVEDEDAIMNDDDKFYECLKEIDLEKNI